ncbi:hypothetical protein WMY93_022967 [Mugilogobius chulae]|uniref:Uncharacterized protein n=1 Tax=Mugilogobius chulae TaxID=88201 RepID=A0AAW0N9U1_9GOBI
MVEKQEISCIAPEEHQTECELSSMKGLQQHRTGAGPSQWIEHSKILHVPSEDADRQPPCDKEAEAPVTQHAVVCRLRSELVKIQATVHHEPAPPASRSAEEKRDSPQ